VTLDRNSCGSASPVRGDDEFLTDVKSSSAAGSGD
jgi:hypothetical protein